MSALSDLIIQREELQRKVEVRVTELVKERDELVAIIAQSTERLDAVEAELKAHNWKKPREPRKARAKKVSASS